MARSLLSPNFKGKISDVKLKEVSMDGCNIIAVTCSGDICERKQLCYPFEPCLKSASEVRSRMVSIHHKVCAPNPLWLVMNTNALAILILLALMGYATQVLGLDVLTAKIEDGGWNKLISMIFGSAAGCSNAIWYTWLIGWVAHIAEAI